MSPLPNSNVTIVVLWSTPETRKKNTHNSMRGGFREERTTVGVKNQKMSKIREETLKPPFMSIKNLDTHFDSVLEAH